jgi:hypothetical protein
MMGILADDSSAIQLANPNALVMCGSSESPMFD